MEGNVGSSPAPAELDLHAWLEGDSPEALEWQRGQDALAMRELRGWSGYAGLVTALGPHMVNSAMAAPRAHGGRWFRAEMGAFWYADTPRERGRLLLEWQSLSTGGAVALGWWQPSTDGRFIAFGASENGDEQDVLRVIDVNSGSLLPDRIPHTSFCQLAWMPGSDEFYFGGGIAADTVRHQKLIFRYRLRSPKAPIPEPIDFERPHVFPEVSPDGRWVAALSGYYDIHPDWFGDVASGRWWRTALTGKWVGAFVGDDYVAVTHHQAPRGRVVAVPVATAHDPSTWRELVPEGDTVMRWLVRVGDHLVLWELVETASRLRLLSLDGALAGEVSLPGTGTASPTANQAHHSGGSSSFLPTASQELCFIWSGPTQPPSALLYDFGAGRLESVAGPPEPVNGISYEFQRPPADDGARLGLHLLYRTGLDRSRPQPTLVYAYGGHSAAILPAYPGPLLAFAEAGGILALACVRGGGEFGDDWYHAAVLERKARSFDDLADIARHLARERVAERDRLALVGASTGGLLAAGVAVRQPELWGAVVVLKPVVDLLSAVRVPFQVVVMEEYGDPRRPQEALGIAAWSPYQQIRAGTQYPAVLVAVGANDVRCPPGQGRKLAAALQAADQGGGPILFRAWPGVGHSGTWTDTAENVAEFIGFVMSRFGMRPMVRT